MNLTPRWVPALCDAGHEAKHWSELGAITAQDSTICDYARNEGFVLITNDLDFPRILAHTLERKPSVILLRGEPLIPEIRSVALVRAIVDYAAELQAGAILSIDWSDRARAHLLPLK